MRTNQYVQMVPIFTGRPKSYRKSRLQSVLAQHANTPKPSRWIGFDRKRCFPAVSGEGNSGVQTHG